MLWYYGFILMPLIVGIVLVVVLAASVLVLVGEVLVLVLVLEATVLETSLVFVPHCWGVLAQGYWKRR